MPVTELGLSSLTQNFHHFRQKNFEIFPSIETNYHSQLINVYKLKLRISSYFIRFTRHVLYFMMFLFIISTDLN